MPLELTKISAEKLNALPRTQTVFFFPVGPMEDHGPHLPMGLDVYESQHLCMLAAERLENELPGWVAIVMPAAPLGVDSNTKKFAITVRAHVLRDWLIDSCRSLAKAGFLHFVCFSGHLGPRQLTAIEEAGKMLLRGKRWLPGRQFRNQPKLISACSASVLPSDAKHAPFWPDAKEHGGRRDTSVALHLVPGQVDHSFSTLPPVKRPSSFWTRALRRWRNQTTGYWGSPADGNADEGSKIFYGTLEDVFPKIRAALEGANPNHLFRSWYSVLPPNKAFFKIWILAIVLIVILWIWVYINVRGLISQ